MIETFAIVAIVVLIVTVFRHGRRLKVLEREIAALRAGALAISPEGAASPAQGHADEPSAAAAAGSAEADVPATGPWDAVSTVAPIDEPPAQQPQPGPAVASSPEPSRKKPDIETALGTRWAVWVGGLALALGGLFLVRYSIEAGIFGPGVRLLLAGLLGLALLAGGEFIRRTGFKVAPRGAAGAYVPGILTAAGSFTLFGAIYAAHGVYGFIGPALSFLLLGLIGVATIAAALVHGQALAGLGLLGAMVTPALVSSQSPNAWALFVYVAIVLCANTVVARLRDWRWPAAGGFLGAGIWTLLYMSEAQPPDFNVVLFIGVATLGIAGIAWSRDADAGRGRIDWPTIVPAFFVALTAALLLATPELQAIGGIAYGAVLIFAMLLVAFYRPSALPLLHAAGVATVAVYAQAAFTGTFEFHLLGSDFTVEGFPPSPLVASLRYAGTVLAILFLVEGFWAAWRSVGSRPALAAAWAGWGALVPLAGLAAFWAASGNLDRDLPHAVAAAGLAAILVATGEALARREMPPLKGGLAVSFSLFGAGAAFLLMLHMAFGPLMTTVIAGLFAAVPALATRMRSYPALGWLSVGTALIVIARIAFDPTIVGTLDLGTTPVFNALLPGYGVPALAFGFAAWQLARTTSGRPRLAMEAAAALLGLLTLAMLVRHAMNGGVIDTGAPTLAEQSIYTLIALGAGAILIAIDMRSPSSVLRIGSLAAGVVSVVCAVTQHFLLLNPLFTDESTGRIPVFNLLFLAYLLPAIAAAALAFYARGRRPRWYSAMLGLLSAALVFAYATLSVRRLFQGPYIAYWAGLGQVENYAYSALWLVMGVVLLIVGVWRRSQPLRIASGVLVAIAVAKVFVFDMSQLEGVLRALSFIGLGAVLIGIGLFYQRLLTRTTPREETGSAA
jgi:uncharacterized membrane protein